MKSETEGIEEEEEEEEGRHRETPNYPLFMLPFLLTFHLFPPRKNFSRWNQTKKPRQILSVDLELNNENTTTKKQGHRDEE